MCILPQPIETAKVRRFLNESDRECAGNCNILPPLGRGSSTNGHSLPTLSTVKSGVVPDVKVTRVRVVDCFEILDGFILALFGLFLPSVDESSYGATDAGNKGCQASRVFSVSNAPQTSASNRHHDDES